MKIIKSNLKQLLEKKGMNQKELAIATETRQAIISALCNNEIKRYPKDVIEKIITVLELKSLDELFSIGYVDDN